MAVNVLHSDNEQQESMYSWLRLKLQNNFIAGRFRESQTVFFLTASNTTGFIFKTRDLLTGCFPCFRFGGLADFAI